MSRYHIVSFSTTHAPEVLSELSRGLAALGTECKRDGKPYIRSVRGGRQNSTESHHHGMQVTVIMKFTNEDDLKYYLDTDPVHQEFKAKAATMGVNGVVVLDFVDGEYP